MDFVRRHWPGNHGHKYRYAPLGEQGAVSAQQRALCTRKHSLLVVMLVLLGGMAVVLATG